MNRNNNLSPIPFYESLAEQHSRKWYTYNGTYINNVEREYLCPFFFVVDDDSLTIAEVKLFNSCDVEYDKTLYTWLNAFPASIASYSSGGCKTFYYTASYSTVMPDGLVYFQIVLSDGSSRYSEMFCANDYDIHLDKRQVRVKWYDAADVELPNGGVIPYAHASDGIYYGQWVYLDTEIGMPQYSFTEDGEERDGRFFPIKQISEKVYKFKCVLPEYMCDCLRLVGLSDVVIITDQYGREYDVEHFEMEVEWLEGGALAEVEFTFETDTVVKKIAKNYGTIIER